MIVSKRRKNSIYILSCLDVTNATAGHDPVWCPVCGDWKKVVREILSV
jgi:hypothetical protein